MPTTHKIERERGKNKRFISFVTFKQFADELDRAWLRQLHQSLQEKTETKENCDVYPSDGIREAQLMFIYLQCSRLGSNTSEMFLSIRMQTE